MMRFLHYYSRLAAFVVWAGGAAAADVAESGASVASRNPRHTGSPFVRTWLAEDYGAHPSNHCLLQHPRTGLIYVGNNSGVLEFDGERWRLIPTPSGAAVSSLVVDPHGRIWGCAGVDIFRLEPDARGELRARSMRERLTAAGAELPDRFNKCVATIRGIYATDRLRLWFLPEDEGPAQTWRLSETNAALLELWKEDDEPHVLVGEQPVVVARHRAGKIERLPPNRPVGVRTLPDGSKQYLTTDKVEWRGDRGTRSVRYPLKDDSARAGTFLADGRIAIGTFGGGLVICDGDGHFLQRIDRADGLPANAVNDIVEDREGGVWVALHFGLARLQLDSPYARQGPAQGVDGTVQSLDRDGARLYAGSTEGLFARGADGKFVKIPGTFAGQRDVFVHGEWVYAMSPYLIGLRQDGGDKLRRLETRNYYGMVALEAWPGWFAMGANDGLRWARFEGDKWIGKGPLHSPRVRSRALLEAPAGVVWALFASDGVWRIDFRDGLRPDAPSRRFDAKDGLPQPPSAMLLLGGEIVAVAAGQLLRFDAASGGFAPETRVAGLAPRGVERAYADRAGTIWIQGPPPTRELGRLVADGPGRWRVEALPGEPLRHLQPTALFHEPETQTLWIGGHGIMISRDLTWQPTRPAAAPAVMVRRIETGAGALLGASSDPATGLALAPLRAENNALRISFAAPAYASDHNGGVHTVYRTRLDGLDRDWTAWSRRTDRDFTNLPWRKLTFRVQARDDAGRAGPEATIAFAIVPPWWASWWAWAGYGAVGLVSVAGFVRRRTQALHRRAEKLEAAVAERTRELAASNAELARLNRLELDEKIAAQLAEEKARLEVLRYQLNPHFLYNSLNSIYGLLFENARGAGEMVVRLSDFCRATLTGPKDDLPALETEVDALRSYLDVEKIRWGERLQVEFAITPEAAQARLPPFLLLPLIENAVKYGRRTTRDVLRIRISATRAEGALHIAVTNSGTWVTPGSPRPDSTGIGLENLRQRLRRYYPGAHEFVTEEKDGTVTARLRLTEAALQAAAPPAGRN